MKVQYFADTDTLYIEFRDRDIAQSKNLDENTVLDLVPMEMYAQSPLSMRAIVPMCTI
jgi:Protein of unknown function (DUF2283)